MTKVCWYPSMLAVGLLTSALSPVVLAAELRGSLHGMEALQPVDPPAVTTGRLFYWEEPNGVFEARRHRRASAETDFAVVVTGPNVNESHEPVRVSVRGGRCLPGTVVVVPNGTIDVSNADWFVHEFFATPSGQSEPVESFAPSLTPSGSPDDRRAHRQAQIAQPGLYELRDRVQPQFRCWIAVAPAQGRLVVPNADGNFHTPVTTDGDYNLKVYFEGRMLAETTVHVANVATSHDINVPAINLGQPTGAGADSSGGNNSATGHDAAGQEASAERAASPPSTAGSEAGSSHRRRH